MTDSNATLLPCPFCGGEADVMLSQSRWGQSYTIHHDAFGKCPAEYVGSMQFATEAEAIAAWNSRTPIEYDGWFYLPKPKEQLFNYTTGFSFDPISMKANGTVGVYAITSAIQKWQEEALNAQIIERICEVFKPERTCRNEHGRCSACGAVMYDAPNYCPNCGARVVE